MAVLLSLAAVLTPGCATLSAENLNRELVVLFEEGSTPEDVARVREACSSVGGIVAEPAGPDNAANRRYPLRFDLGDASDRERTALYACLNKDSSVKGALEPDPS